MALDPNIPLMARIGSNVESAGNLASSFERGLARGQQDRQFSEDLAERRTARQERTRLAEEELALRREQIEMQRALKAYELGKDADKRRIESVVHGGAELGRFYDESGTLADPEGAQAYLQRRLDNIRRHNELYPQNPISDRDTRRAMEQLQKDPQGLYGQIQRDRELGLRMGILEPTPQEKLALEQNTPLGRLTQMMAEERLRSERLSQEKTQSAIDKAEREAAAEQEKKERRVAEKQAQAEIVTNKIDKALDILKSESFVTGFSGQLLSNIGGTDARNLDAQLKTIRSALAFDSLQKMRENSPTGGALGQVSNIELSLLESAVAALDQAQTAEQLKEQLEEVRRHYENWRGVVEEGRIPEGTVIRNAQTGERRIYRNGQWQATQ